MYKLTGKTPKGLLYPQTPEEAASLLRYATEDIGYPPSYCEWIEWIEGQPELSATCGRENSPIRWSPASAKPRMRWADAYTKLTGDSYSSLRFKAEAQIVAILDVLARWEGAPEGSPELFGHYTAAYFDKHLEAAGLYAYCESTVTTWVSQASKVIHLKAGVPKSLKPAAARERWVPFIYETAANLETLTTADLVEYITGSGLGHHLEERSQLINSVTIDAAKVIKNA